MIWLDHHLVKSQKTKSIEWELSFITIMTIRYNKSLIKGRSPEGEQQLFPNTNTDKTGKGISPLANNQILADKFWLVNI